MLARSIGELPRLSLRMLNQPRPWRPQLPELFTQQRPMQSFSILLLPIIWRLILPDLYRQLPIDQLQSMPLSFMQRLRRQLARSFWRLAQLPVSSMLQQYSIAFCIMSNTLIRHLLLPAPYLKQPLDQQQWMPLSSTQLFLMQLSHSFWRLARLPANSTQQHPSHSFRIQP